MHDTRMHDIRGDELFLREATEEDLSDILELYRAAGIDRDQSFTVEEARAHLALLRTYPSFRLFVAVAGQALVGTYELVILDNMAKRGLKSAVLEDVAVHPYCQGRGVGRAMIQHALEQCRHAGCYKLTLSSNLKRVEAHGFYEALGFARHGYSFQIEIGES